MYFYSEIIYAFDSRLHWARNWLFLFPILLDYYSIVKSLDNFPRNT